jgi:hypothetical protein
MGAVRKRADRACGRSSDLWSERFTSSKGALSKGCAEEETGLMEKSVNREEKKV